MASGSLSLPTRGVALVLAIAGAGCASLTCHSPAWRTAARAAEADFEHKGSSTVVECQARNWLLRVKPTD